MISIIIPTLNEEKFIGNLLDSLSQQDFDDDLEVVVADAGSTDSTKEIVKRYKNSFKRIAVVTGGTPAVGRNNGAKASSGDPIFFIDADMLIPDKDFLKKAVNYFWKNNLTIATVYLKPNSRYWIDHFLVSLYNFWLSICKFLRASGSMCIISSRDNFNKTGGYPENVVMCEDHDFVHKSSKSGRYGVIPLHLLFSMRRFNKEGRLVLVFKYLVFSLHLILLGPIKKPIFKYEFGNYKD